MELKKITEKQYEKFIKEQPDILFFHSVEWGRFKSETNWDMEIVGMYDNKKIVAASILLSQKIPFLKKKMYYSPRGLVLDYSNYNTIKEYTIRLKEYLKEKDAVFLKINPYIKYRDRDKDGNVVGSFCNQNLINYLKKLGYKHYGFYKKFDKKRDLEPRWLSVLDISNKSVDELLKDMRTTTRWMIGKSQKNYITIKKASYDDLGKFKSLMQHTAQRRKFDDRDLSYYQTMYKELKNTNMLNLMFAHIDLEKLKGQTLTNIKKLEDKIKTMKVTFKNKNQVSEFKNQIKSLNKRLEDINYKTELYGNNPLIAAGLYLSYGDQVVYLFGGSYKDFMHYGAQYLMQYEMIKYAKDNNFKKINFYGIDGDFKEKAKYYGLFDFKRGFNADVVELIGEFDLVLNKTNYILYKIMFAVYKLLKKCKRLIKK